MEKLSPANETETSEKMARSFEILSEEKRRVEQITGLNLKTTNSGDFIFELANPETILFIHETIKEAKESLKNGGE